MQRRIQQTALLHRRIDDTEHVIAQIFTSFDEQLCFLHICLCQWISHPVFVGAAVLILNDGGRDRYLQHRDASRPHFECAQHLVFARHDFLRAQHFVVEKGFCLLQTLKLLLQHHALKLFLHRHIEFHHAIEFKIARRQFLDLLSRIDFIFLVLQCLRLLLVIVFVVRVDQIAHEELRHNLEQHVVGSVEVIGHRLEPVHGLFVVGFARHIDNLLLNVPPRNHVFHKIP
mmetsp:Transcript_61038/g.97067  ORF Transcript_61038/g.97067 Transcript_61038/m.97067 type:complete len:229 (-) Transcript_61038:2097-2783(-)